MYSNPSGHLYDFETVERKGRWCFVPDAIFPKPSRLLSGMGAILTKLYEQDVTEARGGLAAGATPVFFIGNTYIPRNLYT